MLVIFILVFGVVCSDSSTDTTSQLSPQVEQEIPDTRTKVSVLMVGNSLLGGVKGHLSTLLDEGGYAPEIDVSNPGGYFLHQHNEYAPTLAKIKHSYNIVLLQEQSGSIGRHVAPYPTIRALEPKINASGGSMGFYQTWAFSNRDSKATEDIPEKYEALGEAFDAPVINIGRAWTLFYETYPQRPFELFSDKVHSSQHGKCLISYVLYAYLTGENPVGMSLLSIGSADAEILQDIAWKTYQHYSS